jgi:hypothetical protein
VRDGLATEPAGGARRKERQSQRTESIGRRVGQGIATHARVPLDQDLSATARL